MIPSRRRNARALTGLLALATAVTAPASLSIMAESANAQSLAAELLPAAALPAALATTDQATLRLAADTSFENPTDEETSFTERAPVRVAATDKSLVCMAKVIVHEARNQPRMGQLAVAQLIMARLASGRFGDSVCGVIHQPGQFFDTTSYNPDRTSEAWATAVEVSREALEGVQNAVVPGALFYHAAYQAPPSFFRSRERVATLGDHIFYR